MPSGRVLPFLLFIKACCCTNSFVIRDQAVRPFLSVVAFGSMSNEEQAPHQGVK